MEAYLTFLLERNGGVVRTIPGIEVEARRLFLGDSEMSNLTDASTGTFARSMGTIARI